VTTSANSTGHWKRKPWPASGKIRTLALGRCSPRMWLLIVGIIVSLSPFATRVGWGIPAKAVQLGAIRNSPFDDGVVLRLLHLIAVRLVAVLLALAKTAQERPAELSAALRVLEESQRTSSSPLSSALAIRATSGAQPCIS
jgi:hypothetical protein